MSTVKQFVLPFKEFEKSGQPLIYKAVNTVNGKYYIGMTIVGISDRKSKHFYFSENGGRGKFSAAIRKHGRDKFEFSVISVCDSIEECKNEEKLTIKALSPSYNLTGGGDGVWGLRHSEEAKRKMSEAKKGRKGHPCPDWLRKKNAELRRSEKGKVQRLSRRKKVVCINDGRIFSCTSEAAEYYGIAKHIIVNSVINNSSKNSTGLIFRRGEG